MSDSLRPYQAGLLNDVEAALVEHRSVVLQLPTGGGKTHIALEVTRNALFRGERVWFVTHRREILQQTAASFAEAGIPHSLAGAGHALDAEADVQICSIGSLVRRRGLLRAPDICVLDEAHHIGARTWADLMSSLPGTKHLGLTATPDRLDGAGLGRWFAHLIVGPHTHELIEQGYLSPFRLFGPTIPDLRRARTRGGEYDKKSVQEEMSRPVLIGDVVSHYKRLAPGARAVAFAISTEASKAVVERFCAAGIAARHVDAKTPAAERDAAVEALRTGEIKVLSNVEIFTEGFDLPAIDAVILLRPTKSLALYRQMVGRGLRTAPGKSSAVIIDHAGCVYEHGLPDEGIVWTLDGWSRAAGAGSAKDQGSARLRRCPVCSAVHEWAAECPECGRAYVEVDQTLESIYGRLIRISPPEDLDHESKAAFARRCNVHAGSVGQWADRGLPIRGDGCVQISGGVEWVRVNYRPLKKEGGRLFSVEAFARLRSCSPNVIRGLLKKGLPRLENGLIEMRIADAWLRKNRIVVEGRLISRKNTGTEHLSFSAFDAFASLPPGTTNHLRKRGLPVGPDGLVDPSEGTVWLTNNYAPRVKAGRGLHSQASFAAEIGLSRSSICLLRKRGLPVGPDGLIDPEPALAWMKENYRPRRSRDLPQVIAAP